jgi:hypothetical protein
MSLFRAFFGKPSEPAEEQRRRRELIADQQEASLKRTHEYLATEQARAATERDVKRSRIKAVGEIEKVGRGQYRTTGWEIDVPDGSGRGRVVEDGVRHTGTLGGFTPAELCAIAHGRNCRKCR